MAHTTFLFWNTNRKPLTDLVAALAASHDVDVVILAECGADPNHVLEALNRGVRGGFHFPVSNCAKITIFTRFFKSILAAHI